MAQTNENTKALRGRSSAYPVIALAEALEKIKSINENLGLNGQFNRESIAAGMGYTSLNGTSARRVAALIQYGLLDREKDMYFLSAAAKQILIPIGDNDRQEAIKKAALKPALFKSIYSVLQGQVLPRQFTNRLIQEFGIEQKAASDVERIFKSTMTTAGILQSNGILKIASNERVQDTAKTTNDTLNDSKDEAQNNLTKTGYLSVELPSGLIISYSDELASAFAFGKFGVVLQQLDDAVTAHSNQTLTENKHKKEEV